MIFTVANGLHNPYNFLETELVKVKTVTELLQ